MGTLKKAERELKEKFISKHNHVMLIMYSNNIVEVVKIKDDGSIKRRFVDKTE